MLTLNVTEIQDLIMKRKFMFFIITLMLCGVIISDGFAEDDTIPLPGDDSIPLPGDDESIPMPGGESETPLPSAVNGNDGLPFDVHGYLENTTHIEYLKEEEKELLLNAARARLDLFGRPDPSLERCRVDQ